MPWRRPLQLTAHRCTRSGLVAIGTSAGWRAFRALILKRRFDVVHFHLPYTAALGRLVVASIPQSKQRPAIVYTEHSQWDKMAILIRGLNRASIGLDQSLIVVSEAAHDALPHAHCRAMHASLCTASTCHVPSAY